MKANSDFEGVYELLEQFDFNELPEKDKIYVLSGITEIEYNNMRNTLKDTETYFSNSGEPDINDSIFNSIIHTNHKPNIILKILNKPVKFYQLAASILLLLGLYAINQYSELPEKNSAYPIKDTIYIHTTDSLSSKLADTVRNIREKIIYITKERDTTVQEKLLSTATVEFDLARIGSPGKIEGIKKFAFSTITSSETLLKN